MMTDAELTLDRLKSNLKTHKETQVWREKLRLRLKLQTGETKPTSSTIGSTATTSSSSIIIPSNAIMLDDDDDILASISSGRQQLLNPSLTTLHPSLQQVQPQALKYSGNKDENDDDDDDEFSTTLEQVIQPLPKQQQQQKDSVEIKTMTTKNPITKTIHIEEETVSPTWEIQAPHKINSIINSTDISYTKQQKPTSSTTTTTTGIGSGSLTSSIISTPTTSSTAAYGLFGTGTNESLDIY